MNIQTLLKILIFPPFFMVITPIKSTGFTKVSPDKSFIVKEDSATSQAAPKSKTVLKEKMGDSLEEVMHCAAELHKSVGALQVTLGHIQSKLVAVSRNLLENSGHIKKASRSELQEGLATLQLAAAELQKQAASVAAVHEKVNKSKCLKAG